MGGRRLAARHAVAAWPPADDRSLAMKFVNWVVDPADRLPVLPPPYGPGEGDDLEAVNAHDLQTRMYDELYNKGGWTRMRLRTATWVRPNAAVSATSCGRRRWPAFSAA